ncbi:peroxidase [Synechococcales cyanobacterium C]|uniref:Peroxidase n=1 Tax=Petrachloros mirabilis ULC683 TaxID=2781853 RepID=A0A8K2ACA0_9CYAN|nr:heme peroxidase family protein [Petrachloros mirabilis]NCJ05309.1 peroxidase [Petrachloros mirabilis ULC683]
MTRHGQLYLRDMVPPRSQYYAQGRFGRMFSTLPPFLSDTPQVRQALIELGKPGGIMDPQDSPANPSNPNNPDNPKIPSGFTFLGQFIDHDLTFDPTSSLERQNDPESIENFRTPMFELDSLYGSGLAASPHLYDKNQRGKFLIDANADTDVPRNSQNIALIGDPRNDENLIVSQLHFAFLKFHNAIMDRLSAVGMSDPGMRFVEAQRQVRWHYQWIVLHEFLPRTVGQGVVHDILQKGRQFYHWQHEPFIPVEFSVAAYRFGHSQVRPGYRVNSAFAASIFGAPGTNDLSGDRRIPLEKKADWKLFFEFPNEPAPALSKKIDVKLSTPLFQLPFLPPNMPTNPNSLAQRNLLRHLTFSLPSGQAVAQAMEVEPLTAEELAEAGNIDPMLATHTPLWFYILQEADKRAEGHILGPVGGRIVAEVFIGLLQGDRMSFLNQCPKWQPTLGATPGSFSMADLFKIAGV